MNTLFIVNPAAGRGKCFRKWAHLEDLLHEHASFAFAVRLTRKPGDAENFAITAIQEGFERIISVGGDGTVNEIINGIAGTNVQIGILPFGTGNDLARILQWGHGEDAAVDVANYLRKLIAAKVVALDR